MPLRRLVAVTSDRFQGLLLSRVKQKGTAWWAPQCSSWGFLNRGTRGTEDIDLVCPSFPPVLCP
eukprot:3503394-Pyramimonas_sp.AAC.1